MPRESIKGLFKLVKFNLNLLVVVTTTVGFLIASRGMVQFPLLWWTVSGTLLAACGSAALNQYMERHRDARMVRTRKRPIPSGLFSPEMALAIGLLTGISGVAMLALKVNWLTALLALLTQLIYLLWYTPMKIRNPLNTLVGGICGAIPPMMGFSAVYGYLPLGAWLLAAFLFVWQIPHFLALSWMYREDYKHGGYQMLPSHDPQARFTFPIMLYYSLILLPIGLSLTVFGYSGWWYGYGSLLLGAALVYLGYKLVRGREYMDARRLFFATVIYLPLMLLLMVLDIQPHGHSGNFPTETGSISGEASSGLPLDTP
ncbi:heme o synthase [bacterium]|nr:heme o synthase [bacterium]